MFIPSVAGIGIAPVLYSYTDVSGCYNSASSSITVNEAPVVSIGNDTTLCAGSSILLNAGNAFSHYLWSTGSVQSVVTIDSSGVGIASTDIFVEVGNSFGCFITDTVQITFAICSGIENGNNYDALSFYPNPFANTFHLSLDLRSDIYICDSTGRLVEKFGQKNGEVVLGADLSPGIYSVMVSCKDTVKILRVVKSAGN
ncbi:MAG: T9SS type A sorting domain-containing protein [Bacteroidetes bacterium]|nr:T9SS type A sorting domain-containing protein [Bacteroidota bacterium]